MTNPAPDTRPCIRGPRRDDQGYVATTWLRQLSDVQRDYTAGSRWGQAGTHVDMVLDRPDTRFLVCHVPGKLDRILGWLCHAAVPGVPTVHFIYVRKEQRQGGIARALLEALKVTPETQFVCTGAGPMTAVLQSKYPRVIRMPLPKFLGVSAVDGKPADLKR